MCKQYDLKKDDQRFNNNEILLYEYQNLYINSIIDNKPFPRCFSNSSDIIFYDEELYFIYN